MLAGTRDDVIGGAGRDVLLVAGAGFDVAVGGGATDCCDAELRLSCGAMSRNLAGAARYRPDRG